MLGRVRHVVAAVVGVFSLAAIALGQPSWKVSWNNKTVTGLSISMVNGQHYVPTAELDKLGWKVSRDMGGEVSLNSGDNQVNVPLARLHGLPSISLESACERFDFSLDHDDVQQTLTVLPRIEVIRYLSNHLMVDSSGSISPDVTVSSNGNSLSLIFSGTAVNPDLVTELDPGLQLKVLGNNSLEIQIQGNFPPSGKLSKPINASRHLDIDMSQLGLRSPDQITRPPAEPTPTNLTIKELPTNESDLTIPTPHGPYSGLVVKRTGLHVKIYVPGIKLRLENSDTESNAFTNFSLSSTGSDSAIEFDLKNPSGLIVGWIPTSISIRIFQSKLNSSDTSNIPEMPLLDKLLVVDPGHGGKDTGARNAAMGIMEKTLTLQIGTQLAETLARQGAAIVMTRIADTYPTLGDRCDISNSNYADLFLCVHINQVNNPDFRGSITFYHTGRPKSLNLANDVENQLAGVKAIPAIGVWRDTKIAVHSGFYVLRNTKMPSILMELGFISNKQDVLALEDKNVQKQIAIAITYGVEHYLKGAGN